VEGRRLAVIDLGVNVPAATFVEAAIAHDVHIIGISALLTTTMPNM
jgi:5-methyltetrahydrofolate--homocysteine methyltransferase